MCLKFFGSEGRSGTRFGDGCGADYGFFGGLGMPSMSIKVLKATSNLNLFGSRDLLKSSISVGVTLAFSMVFWFLTFTVGPFKSAKKSITSSPS